MNTEPILNGNLCPISYEEIIRATNDNYFPMTLVKDEGEAVMKAVNQGIDAHLEACYIEGTDFYVWANGRLECDVSPESLPVLIRRLSEDDSEELIGMNLADSILTSLGFDEYGKYVGRKALGLE